MATKNGTILSFRTTKVKESPRKAAPSKPITAITPITDSMAMSKGGSTSPTAGGKRIWPTLPSFAPPRDLTLGGRAPKKVFTPNLNVIRNKNLTVKTSRDTTAKRGSGSGRGARGGGRGGNANGRGAKSSTLIQTKGVFSEGAGDFNVRKSAYGRYSNGGGGGGGGEPMAVLQKPVRNKNEFKKFDIKADEKELFEITGDSDDEDCFDYLKTETAEDDLPIRLNEDERRAKLLKIKALKKEVVCKEEEIKKEFLNDDDDDDVSTAQKLQKLFVDSKNNIQDAPLDGQADAAPHSALPHYPKTVNGFLDSTETQLLLLQLPDILPCETDVDSKDFHSKKEQKLAPMEMDAPSTSAGTTRLNLKSDYDWQTMQEGQIGKIIRYKSGKVFLQLGKTLFNLDVSMEPGFMQDVISIRTNDDYERNIGHMINLGPIHGKITATPYWEDCMMHFEAATKAEYSKSIVHGFNGN